MNRPPTRADNDQKEYFQRRDQMLNIRSFGLAAGLIIAATLGGTDVSLADTKKVQTKFINQLPIKVIVTFEGTGVPVGPWYAEHGESKNFLLLPEGTNVRWKAIPGVPVSNFDSCTGSSTIGSGNSSDTIVLNGDHCTGAGHPAMGGSSASAPTKPSSAPASGSGSGSGSTASNSPSLKDTASPPPPPKPEAPRPKTSDSRTTDGPLHDGDRTQIKIENKSKYELSVDYLDLNGKSTGMTTKLIKGGGSIEIDATLKHDEYNVSVVAQPDGGHVCINEPNIDLRRTLVIKLHAEQIANTGSYKCFAEWQH
jgi:hypothetical protein